MGKAIILSHLGKGKYAISLQFNSENKEKQILAIDANIGILENQLTDLTPGTLSYNIVALQITALNKQKAILQTIPDEESVQAWCIDLTENLSGTVGTAEIPGERTDINIQPGHNNNSAYNKGRDGQLTKIMAQTPEQCYFNVSQLPGWQKWKPTFRYAVISNLDGDVCTVTFEDTPSTQQALPINQTDSIAGVEIEYMDCNGVPFDNGDSVVVMFGNQDWSQPKVIGFKDNPKSCGDEFLWIFVGAGGNNWIILWDIETETTLEGVTNNLGDLVTFPVLASEITNWMSSKTPVAVTGAVGFGPSQIISWQETENVYCGNCVDDFDLGCTYIESGGCSDNRCSECDCEVSGVNAVHSGSFIDANGNTEGVQYYLKTIECQGSTMPFESGHRGSNRVFTEIPGINVHRVDSKTFTNEDRGFIRERDGAVETEYYNAPYDTWFGSAGLENISTIRYDYTWKTPFLGDDDQSYYIDTYIRAIATADPNRKETRVSDEIIQFIAEMSEKNLFIFKRHSLRSSYSENTTVGTPLEILSYENQIDARITIHLAAAAEESTPQGSIDPFNVPRQVELTNMVQDLVDDVKIPSVTGIVDKIITSAVLFEA